MKFVVIAPVISILKVGSRLLVLMASDDTHAKMARKRELNDSMIAAHVNDK
jgi:hypothetical protein